MRGVFRLVACAALALLAAACDPVLENRYYRVGIGTELYWQGLPEATRLQQLYLGYICDQAGIPVRAESDVVLCDDVAFRADHWMTFAQAGMNDIDLRCDSYLSWLDEKKRTTQPILKQISDLSTFSQSVMRIAGVGADPITIVGLAFGLAADTFTNVRSRLLLEVNHSTVQTVVLARQREYRALLVRQRIDNRPAAFHVLRSYLRLCMPFTIEMEINNTVVVVERGGPGALLREPPLITPATVAPPMVPREPLRSQDPTSKTVRVVKTDTRYADIIEDYNPAVHSTSLVGPMLAALCAPPEAVRDLGPYVKNLILIYELHVNPGKQGELLRNGKLDRFERSKLSNTSACSSDQRNYFEKVAFSNGTISKPFADLFNRSLPPDQQLPASPTLANSREQIAILRKSFASRLQTNAEGFEKQVTPDLISALRRPN